MSDTFTHVPWFVTNSRISARIGSDDWQDTRRGLSVPHGGRADDEVSPEHCHT